MPGAYNQMLVQYGLLGIILLLYAYVSSQLNTEKTLKVEDCIFSFLQLPTLPDTVFRSFYSIDLSNILVNKWDYFALCAHVKYSTANLMICLFNWGLISPLGPISTSKLAL